MCDVGKATKLNPWFKALCALNNTMYKT